MNRLTNSTAAALLVAGLTASAFAGGSTTVTFDNGNEGWSFNGVTAITPNGGNPGAHIHLVNPDTFGVTCRNDSTPEFIGDFTAKGEVRITVDFDVESITFFGGEVSRNLVIELRDYDNPPQGYPYASVWFDGGLLPAPAAGWKTFTFDIINVNDAALPAGWGGYGAEDPRTFEPVLPDDRTWTDVIDGVDEIVFTTFVPGFFYGFTNFDLRVDNISIQPLNPPCPGNANGDSSVDVFDLLQVLEDFGACKACPPSCASDLTDDCLVDVFDVLAVLDEWGDCP